MQVNNIFDIYKYFVKYPQTAIVFLQHNVVRKHNIMLYDILNIDYQKGMERRMIFQRIRDMREDADLKQNDMAKILHCSQQAYSNYELGQRDIPTDILIALAEYHKTNVDYLLGLTKNKTYYKDM